jgi:hypothetical protein
MTRAEQVHPTAVILTRRDRLKRGAAALVQRREKTSATMTDAASPARANSASATTSGSSRRILTLSSGHSAQAAPQANKAAGAFRSRHVLEASTDSRRANSK